MAEQLDVIVRFHDINRLSELERCVFSLIGQEYRPLHIILALQRFSEAATNATRTALDPMITCENKVTLSNVNWERSEPVDARSALLNLGLEKAQGRYLAFLDYDDVLYPEAYELMVSKLIQSGAAAAFASVRILRLDVYDRFFYATQEVTPPYRGESLLDLFRNNFCPLHSYVIDRNQIPSDLLRFDTSLVMEEDYDLLLRISASLPTDFSLLGTQIGDYYYKTDDSNTVPTNGGLTGESRDRYEEVRSAIELRRRSTPVAIAVQRSLGITETSESMTIRDVIDRIKGRH